MQSSADLRYADRRRYQRKPYARTVSYCFNGTTAHEPKTFDCNGDVVNISETGLCLQAANPLAKGHIIYFDDAEYRAGIVRWCEAIDEFYRVGIEILDTAYADYQGQKPAANSISGIAATEECIRVLDAATEKLIMEMTAIEQKCAIRSETPDAIQQLIRKTIEEMIHVCEDFENKVIDAEIIRAARTRFRERTDWMFSKSYSINRTRIWPQGSQGDYKTLELAYKNMPLSEGIGYYLDRFMLDLPLGHAVRARIKKLQAILKDEVLKRSGPSILNIACGACRELVGIVPEIIDSGAKVICIDNDNDALDYAQGRLADIGLRENIEFYKYNALRLFDYEIGMEDYGKQDIIYSVGLFDYLPSDFLVKIFSTLYKMLKPGGRFIPAFKDAQRYRPQYYHWLADWDGFLQRKEEDFKNILENAGIPSSAITEMRDDTGIIVFYLITK
jgi:extracellular factor (EF) 3-hydroxypalmitic acid methyl ester biosynthesis protein